MDGIGDDVLKPVLANGHIQKMANDLLVFRLELIDLPTQLLELPVLNIELR